MPVLLVRDYRAHSLRGDLFGERAGEGSVQEMEIGDWQLGLGW